jgi:glutathione S-transferase
MKLYDGGRAPNPRRTRVFLAEKGIKLPMVQVDLGAMEHMSAAFAAINPIKRVPALVLDDGTVITESIAICRYFEALQPDPPLFGCGAREIARVEMWNRRLELHLLFPVSHVFRNSHPAMKAMEVPQVPAWARRTSHASSNSSPSSTASSRSVPSLRATRSRSPTLPASSRSTS